MPLYCVPGIPNGQIVLAVGDPRHAGARSELEIARSAAEVVASDNEIRVERLNPTIRVTVNVKGKKGKSLRIAFSLSPEPAGGG